MAFREKTLWASGLLTLGIWGWYFWSFAGALKAGRFDQGAATGEFVLTVALLVVVHIVAAAVLAIVTGRQSAEPADDRERAFALAAYRPAYYTLSAVVVTVMLAAPVLLRIGIEWKPAPPAGLAPILLGNALLLGLVAAELVHTAAQLMRFRVGG